MPPMMKLQMMTGSRCMAVLKVDSQLMVLWRGGQRPPLIGRALWAVFCLCLPFS
jgi:hypothetical protein